MHYVTRLELSLAKAFSSNLSKSSTHKGPSTGLTTTDSALDLAKTDENEDTGDLYVKNVFFVR